jgi:hypothetical protein
LSATSAYWLARVSENCAKSEVGQRQITLQRLLDQGAGTFDDIQEAGKIQCLHLEVIQVREKFIQAGVFSGEAISLEHAHQIGFLDLSVAVIVERPKQPVFQRMIRSEYVQLLVNCGHFHHLVSLMGCAARLVARTKNPPR